VTSAVSAFFRAHGATVFWVIFIAWMLWAGYFIDSKDWKWIRRNRSKR
jgi:hypothetical protein